MALKKILVVSRSADMVSLLKLGLGKDYEVSAAALNEEGILGAILQRKPDLVILDIVMPRAEEIIVGLRIRQSTEIPIIMLSSFNAKKGTVRILNLDDRDFLSGDHTISMLEHLIQRRIQRAI